VHTACKEDAILSRFLKRIRLNPIIIKELRSRMRGGRAFIALTAVLLVLGSVSYALYRMILATSGYATPALSPRIGQALFLGLACLELLAICLVTPAVTAGAVSGEHEGLTFEMLLTTPLSAGSILWGKLFSALSYVFLVIFAAIPMSSLVFIFGGVSPRDMLKALLILLATAVFLGTVGVFFSVWLRRTARATVLSYVVVLLLLAGTLFTYLLVSLLQDAPASGWILAPNPISALISALSLSGPSAGMRVSASSPLLGGLGELLGGNTPPLTKSPGAVPRPLYHYTLVLYGALSLALYLLAARLVRPVRRWRIGRRSAIAALSAILLFLTAVALAFLATTARYEGAGTSLGPSPSEAEGGLNLPARPVRVPAPAPTPTPPPPPPVIDPADNEPPPPVPTPTPWLVSPVATPAPQTGLRQRGRLTTHIADVFTLEHIRSRRHHALPASASRRSDLPAPVGWVLIHALDSQLCQLTRRTGVTWIN
jgi:ABC-type transport system involved in multi-copper enzyme maturation permease subunit